MKIIIGCDHGGIDMKNTLRDRLIERDFEVVDKGVHSVEEVDYPDVSKEVCHTVLEEEALGILVCGTGIGMSMSANKVPGIRAALITDSFSSRMAREHNNANVIAFGARTLGIELASDIMFQFLDSVFLGGKHLKRVNKLEYDGNTSSN